MARPKKYNIDPKKVEQLASYGCTNTEIADFYGVGEHVIRKSYAEFTTKGRTRVKIRLRQAQMQKAIGTEKEVEEKVENGKKTGETKKVSKNDGNVSMQIWLGKQILGQTDTPDFDEEELVEGFDLEEI